MKAIRVREFGGPEVMNLEEVPTPQAGRGQVLVRMQAAGINPVDTYTRAGMYPKKPGLPYTPGIDGAGLVEAIGEEVQGFAVGQRVYVGGSQTGTYAQYAVCEVGQVHPLPERVSFPQGAGINVPYATAYRGLFLRAKALAGETLLVHGATGGVGIAAVQIGRAAGLKVIGTGGTEKGRQLALEQGAHHVVDHTATEYGKQILELTGGKGLDVILEMAAHINLGKDLTMLAPGGRVVVIGSRGPVELNPRDAMVKEAAILGMMIFSASAEELMVIHGALAAGLENGSLRPIVGREMPLGEAAAGHRAVMEPGAHGKIVLLP